MVTVLVVAAVVLVYFCLFYSVLRLAFLCCLRPTERSYILKPAAERMYDLLMENRR